MAVSEKTRILIVDDAAPVREAVRRMLELEDDFLVVGEAANGEEAVIAARRLEPDVILMDINMPRMDGISAARAILAEVKTGIIMVSVEGDLDYLRRAMQSGGKDYLVKPFSPEDLAQAIRRVSREAAAAAGAPPRRGRIITVFGTKGGVGRTTIAANLGVAMALGAADRRVALVDLDLEFGVLAQVLSLKPSSSIVDLCRLSEPVTPARVREVMVNHEDLNLSLLAAPPAPHLAAEVDGEGRAERGRNYVEEILRALREGWDEVIVDTSAGFREASLAALDLADVVLLVTTPDIPALHNTAKALNILQHQLEYPAEKIRVIVNHADGGQGLGVDDVVQALNFPVYLQLPSDRAVAAAVNAGQSILGRRSKSPFGLAVGRLAEKLGRGGAAEASAPSASEGRANFRPFRFGSRLRAGAAQ